MFLEGDTMILVQNHFPTLTFGLAHSLCDGALCNFWAAWRRHLLRCWVGWSKAREADWYCQAMDSWRLSGGVSGGGNACVTRWWTGWFPSKLQFLDRWEASFLVPQGEIHPDPYNDPNLNFQLSTSKLQLSGTHTSEHWPGWVGWKAVEKHKS